MKKIALITSLASSLASAQAVEIGLFWHDVNRIDIWFRDLGVAGASNGPSTWQGQSTLWIEAVSTGTTVTSSWDWDTVTGHYVGQINWTKQQDGTWTHTEAPTADAIYDSVYGPVFVFLNPDPVPMPIPDHTNSLPLLGVGAALVAAARKLGLVGA